MSLTLLRRLWRHVPARRRRQFVGLFVLMLAASAAEVVSIGAIVPFLGALTEPAAVLAHPTIGRLAVRFGVGTPDAILLPLTLVFVVAAIVSGAVRLLLLVVQTRVSVAVGSALSASIYRRTLYQPYHVHVARNSSQVITAIAVKAKYVIFSAVMPVVTVVSAGLMVIAILGALVALDPSATLVSLGGFVAMYGVIILATRARLERDSRTIAGAQDAVVKALQEGLGGIRDVLLDGTQEVYAGIYVDADARLRRAQANVQIVSGTPRFVVEAWGMALIAGLAYVVAGRQGGLAQALPFIGAFALGAQRLLPNVQSIYAAWAAFRAGRATLVDTLDMLDQPLPEHSGRAANPVERLPFDRALTFERVSFRYGAERPWVLVDLDITIPQGSRVGIVGETGCGKSTLLDLLMGLLEPTTGRVLVDGVPLTPANMRAWQRRIAHVPQAIFLADASIAENIAFGVPQAQIDMDRVHAVARQARIDDTVRQWTAGYETRVGERGVQLSGGQRQRIGIARALYKDADVIVFDEATSALDAQTEQAVAESLHALGPHLTVIIVAHRLSTLAGCERIVELAGGRVVRETTYAALVTA